MSNTLKDTMKTAMDGVESVRDGTERTLASMLASLARGAASVSEVVALLRRVDVDDALAWFGLARRSPLRTGAALGAGVALGAGLGLLFAPMSGAELRRAMLERVRGRGARAGAGPASTGRSVSDESSASDPSNGVRASASSGDAGKAARPARGANVG